MRKRKPLRDEYDEFSPPSPRRKRRTWLMLLLAACLVVITFAPTILVHSPLRDSVVAWAVPELAGRLRVGQARLAWWAPPDLRDVTLFDQQERKMLQIGRLECDKTLLQLLTNSRDLGGIHVTHPEAHIVVHQSGSNVEDAVKLFTGDEATDSDPALAKTSTNFRLYLSEGQVTIVDEVTQQTTRLRDVNVTYQPAVDDVQLVTIALAGKVDDANQPGEFSSDISWRPASEPSVQPFGSGTLKAATTQLPLATLKPLLARLLPDLSLQGLLTGAVDSTWSSENRGPVVHLNGKLAIDDVRLAMPSVLGTDIIVDPHVTLELDGWLEHDRLRLEQMVAHSSLVEGKFRLEGPLASWTTGDLRSLLWDPLLLQQFSCQGTINIPRLAESLPTTLHLHDGLVVHEGTIALELGAESVEGVRALFGRVTTNRISGSVGGQSIAWDEPLTIRWDIAATQQGLHLREAICESPFLRMRGSGDFQGGTVQVTADLHELSDRLRRFADLGNVELAGKLDGDGQWKSADGRMSGSAQGSVAGLAWGDSRRSFPEGQVQWRGQWEAELVNGQIQQWLAASLNADSGEDHLQATLTRPVPVRDPSPTWPVQVTVDGELQRWLARVQPWFSLPGYSIQGRVHADVSGELSSKIIHMAPIAAEFTNLQVDSSSINLHEPRMIVNGQLTWDAQADRLLIPEFTMTSNRLAARGQDVRIDALSTRPTPSGNVAYRGDLAQLVQPFVPQGKLSMYPAGNVEGQVQFVFAGTKREYRVTATATPFSLARASRLVADAPALVPIWQEPRLTLESHGTYDTQERLVNCSSLQLTSDSLSLAAQGSLRTTDGYVDASGSYEYDLAKLRGKFARLGSNDWTASGQRKHDFRIKGPLFVKTPAVVSPELQADFAVSWDALRVMGIDIGAQQIAAKLNRGVVDLAPIDASVQGGRIRLDSRVDLTAEPATWLLESPASMENVQITPDLFHQWMKYVAPLLADTTTASGALSVQLTDARVPIGNVQAAMAMGRIQIQEATVRPGLAIQQLFGIINEVSLLAGRNQPIGGGLQAQLASIPSQDIEFQLFQGRVHHRNLQLQLGDAVIRTQGSVGLDQTLSLLAEVPIQEKWLGNERLLQSLRGQTLQLPVQGTLSQPNIDRRAIAQLTQQALSSTAERALQDELQKGLQKLLGPK